MKKIFLVFFIVICSSSYSKENKSNESRIISDIGYSLKPMTGLDEFANKSDKFKNYCWEKPKEIKGCFRNSSVILLGYNKNNFAYLYRVAYLLKKP